MKILYPVLLFSSLLTISTILSAQKIQSNKQGIIFSAIKGTTSKPDTLELKSLKGNVAVGEIKITGEQANFFKTVTPTPKNITNGKTEDIALVFQPGENFTGVAHGTLELKKIGVTISLTGLSTKGLEGENEAPLSLIVDALGYSIDVGWKTLANNLQPALQGEELAPALFKKLDQAKPVTMLPVARYSPDFTLNFGLYTNEKNGPRQHQNGILAKAAKFPEHQILFPEYSGSASAYEPGDKPFGFYSISPSHTVYSEDLWNMLFYPTHAAHAMRVYPVRKKGGDVVKDTYLVCMEEAANGDYNDYVFLVSNIEPIFIDREFTALMNGKNLDGWYTYLKGKEKNNDPDKVFTVQSDGVLHDTGKDVGYIMTNKSFGNYHFKLDFKWGNDRWPPRENTKRDSGICYNIPEDETDNVWPQSVECQIQEGDVGDFWLLGNSTIQVDGKQNLPHLYSRVAKKKDAEKPNGEWNTVEVISFNGKCVHLVNGVVVNYGENSSLIGGRILLQSEYAEIYYKNVSIREL